MVVELWALRDGLTLANNLNIDSLIIKVDDTAVIQAINSPTITNNIFSFAKLSDSSCYEG